MHEDKNTLKIILFRNDEGRWVTQDKIVLEEKVYKIDHNCNIIYA